MSMHLTLMGNASRGLPRNGLVALYDPYRDTYGRNVFPVGSEDMTTWNRFADCNTVIEGGYPDPFGGNNAYKITTDGVSANYFVWRGAVGIVGSPVARSIYVKRGDGGAGCKVATSSGLQIGICTSTDWERISGVSTEATPNYCGIDLRKINPTDAVEIYVFGPQLNLGSTLFPYSAPSGAPDTLQTATDYSGLGNHAVYGTTAGVDANDPANNGLAYTYDGVDDVFTNLPTSVRSYVLAGDSFGTGAGWVCGKRTNVKGRVYYALFYNRRLSEAEEARLWTLGQGILARRGFAGTYYNWAYPIVTTAGVMDFSVKTTAGRLWVFPDGSTSTAERPAPNLASGGTTWVYCPNWRDPALEINDNGTDARYVGNLADLPRVTYYLNLNNCSNVTGTLADAPRVTYYLDLRNCTNVTGTLADVPRVTNTLDLRSCSNVTGALADLPRVTYTLNLYNCNKITGTLADLPRVTYFLSLDNCSNVTGTLADAPRVTYYLSLYNCSNVTGTLADLPRVTYYLDLFNCSNVTGTLADVPRVTYYLNLYKCNKITGTLADAPRVTYYLSLYNCSNVTGTLDGTWCPTILDLRGIGWSTAECDASLINLANGSLTNKSLTISAGKRSSASDAAKATLISRGWTVTES